MSAEGVWIGHLYLRPPGAAEAGRSDQVTIELDQAVPSAEELLPLRLLSPLAALLPDQRRDFRILFAGEGCALAERAARALDLAQITRWEDQSVASELRFQRVLMGCGGSVPKNEQLKPLIAHLRQDGELGLFDLPAAELVPLHQALAEQGLALRSAGSEGLRGFLSGSIEEPQRFSA